jgi:hypothetical protein
MRDHDNGHQGQDRPERHPDHERRGAAGRGGPQAPGGRTGDYPQEAWQPGGDELVDNDFGGMSARTPQDPNAGQGNPDPALAYANSSTGGLFGYDQNRGNYRGRDALDERSPQSPLADPAKSSPQHGYGPDRGAPDEGQGGYASANNPDNHLVEMPSPELYSQYGLARQGGHEFQHDPEYHQWRSEQMRKLDSEYREWRKERYDKFSDDFNSWRSKRSASAGNAGAAPGPATLKQEQADSAPDSGKAGPTKT